VTSARSSISDCALRIGALETDQGDRRFSSARWGCAIDATIEVLGALWSMLVLRDGIFGNRRHSASCSRRGQRMLSNWSSESGSAVTSMTVVQHSAEALPPTGVLCPFLAAEADAVPCLAATVGLPAAPHPRAGVNGCGGRKARW
jgi:hypothetical protein